jgi:hypothetical protein
MNNIAAISITRPCFLFITICAITFGSLEAQIVSDGGFESPTLPAGTWSYNTTNSAWMFSARSGLTTAPSSQWHVPTGWDGAQVAMLQSYAQQPASISQVVTLPFTGVYQLSWKHAGRPAIAGVDGDQRYDVEVGGVTIAPNIATSSGQTFTPRAVTFYQYAGTYSLVFRAVPSSGDHTAYLDSVDVTCVSTNATLASIYTAVEVCWPSETSKQYQLQWSSAVDSTNWFSMGSQVSGTGTNICVFDSTRGHEKRFYRVITIE